MDNAIANIDNGTLPKSTPKYIPIEAIQELIEVKNLSFSQAGKVLGCSKQAISVKCKKYGIQPVGFKKYKKNLSDIIKSKQRIILNSLTMDDVKRMRPLEKITGWAILYDKSRLQDDKSTSNVMSYHEHHLSTAEIEAKLTELKSLRMGENG